ncbi:signal peptidase II [Nanoarchaeota archaeon]
MTSPRTFRLMNFVEHNLALVIVAVTIIVVERMVKFYVTQNLRIGESIRVIGNFLRITRAENTGAGFGILQGQSWLFVLAALVVMVLIIYFYNQIIYNMLLVFAFALILGGTVGNLMDRLFFGHVIDYIDLAFWPTFNLSDLALSAGALLLIVYLYMCKNQPEKEAVKYVHY